MTEWKHTLDLAKIWGNDALSFEQQRDLIVRRINEAKFSFPGQEQLVADLKREDSRDLFNDFLLPRLEEFCTKNAVWIKHN